MLLHCVSHVLVLLDRTASYICRQPPTTSTGISTGENTVQNRVLANKPGLPFAPDALQDSMPALCAMVCVRGLFVLAQ